MNENRTPDPGLSQQQIAELQRQYQALEQRLEKRWRQLSDLSSTSPTADPYGPGSISGPLSFLRRYRTDLYFALLLLLFVVHVAFDLHRRPADPTDETARSTSVPGALGADGSDSSAASAGRDSGDNDGSAPRPSAPPPADPLEAWQLLLDDSPAEIRPCLERLTGLESGTGITPTQSAKAKRALDNLETDPPENSWARAVCFQAAIGEVLGIVLRVDGQPVSQPTRAQLEQALPKLGLEAGDFDLAAGNASLQAAVVIAWLERQG